MDESTRRRWAAAKMRELGYGVAAIVHRATGLDPKTLSRGNRDLKKQEASPCPEEKSRRIRQKGGGRKPLRSQDSTPLSDLDARIEPTVRGDPRLVSVRPVKALELLPKNSAKRGTK